MTSAAQHLDAFASIKWATPFLESPDWCARPRTRIDPSERDPNLDRFNRDTISSYNGMEHWVELYQKPAPGSNLVTRTISLCKYGTGFMGFRTVCHGGAILTMMDEALSFAMIAHVMTAVGKNTLEWVRADDNMKKALEAGQPIEDALKDFMVTARLNTQFVKPVRCPGIVGIDVTVVESKEHKLKIQGTMKDGEGVPLVKTEGLWIKVRGGAKI